MFLRLSLLISNLLCLETMRREGFELTVSPPKVLAIEEDGEKKEPFEEVTLDVDHEYQGSMMESINKRTGVINEIRVSFFTVSWMNILMLK